MRYFDYFIKCIIRNFVRLFIKPICIVIVVFIVFVLFMFVDSVFASESLAFETPNYAVWNDKAFNSLGGGKVSVTSYSGLHGRAVYFKPNIKGILNIGFSSNEFHVAKFVQYTVPTLNDEGFDYYYTTTGGSIYFDTTIGTYNQTGYWLVYYSVDLTSQNPTYSNIEDYSNSGIINAQEQTTNAIQEQTIAIEEQTEAINNIDDTLTSTDYDEDVVEIDSSAVDDIDSTASDGLFTTIFTNFSNLINNSDWTSVETITINLPYVPSGNGIVLRSDLISSVVGNSVLSTLIVVSWYSLFGLYCFKFVRKIIISIKSGDVLGGINLDDEVITSTML